jgi:membrane protein DedA with SNARE-associated domain
MGGTLQWLLSLSGQIEEWILGIADAWWVHLVVYALATLDGFFPTVPSESVIVTLSSLWASSGQPSLILLGLAAWLGAWTGDNLGYLLGSKIGWERFRFLREGRGRRAVEAADRGLQKRALIFLMTARYIPFGRTAVNLVAGAVHYPHRHFWPRSLLSTFVWATYSCAIGAIAGSWFADHHMIAIVVALVAAVVIALVLERLINALHKALDRRAERREAAAGAADAENSGDAESVGDAGGSEGSSAPGPSQDAESPSVRLRPTEAPHPDPERGTPVPVAADSPHTPDRHEDTPA